MDTFLFFVICAILIFCAHNLKSANEKLTPEQKEILRKRTFRHKIRLYTIPFGLAILILFLIALIEMVEPSFLPLSTTFSIKIILVVIIVTTAIFLYGIQYYQLKALGFPHSYLRSFILYGIGFYTALMVIAFIHPVTNDNRQEYLYWNGYWDPACSKCWPQPQTESNNHCTPSDCVLQGNYRCQPQQPPLSRSNDPRLIQLIKSGQCKFVH